MTTRRDLYGECNLKGAPVAIFTAECCAICLNPECTRSAFKESKFDVRTKTWFERLFLNPPKMIPNDPRYDKIANQKFLVISPSSDWIDPRDEPPSTLIETNIVSKSEAFPNPIPKSILKPASEADPKPELVPKPEPVPECLKSDSKQLSEPKPEPKPEPEPELSEPEPPEPEPKFKPVRPPNLVLTNTPIQQQGQMVSRGNKKDPWDAPVPTNDTANIRVIKPGGKVVVGR